MRPPVSLLLLALLAAGLLPSPASAARFSCNAAAGRRASCQALLGYAPPNATTLAAVKALFGLRSLRSLLAANSLPLATPASSPVPAGRLLRLRLPCSCLHGHGYSARRQPRYRLRPGDSLAAIARGVFAGFVTEHEIAAVNNVTDPYRVATGREVWIPLPCSCDPVGGDAAVVHYAHVVAPGSTVAGIAAEFGTEEAALLRLNRIEDPKSLQAGQILDVPLRACSSLITRASPDHGLRIPNGSYILTADNCVLCSCSSSSWQLDCHLTQGISTSVCPAAMCGSLYLGNSSSSSACESKTCAYAGYTTRTSFTILTNLTTQSLCNNGSLPLSQPSTSSVSALGLELQEFDWTKGFVLLHIALLCFGFL